MKNLKIKSDFEFLILNSQFTIHNYIHGGML